MNLVLKGCAEEMDFQQGESQHQLVFLVDGRREVRVPVPRESISYLVDALYGSGGDGQKTAGADYEPQAHGDSPALEEHEATQFGGEEEDEQFATDEELGEEEVEEDEVVAMVPVSLPPGPLRRGPRSEDEVPSL